MIILLIGHITQDHDYIHTDKYSKISTQRNAESFAIISSPFLMRISECTILRSYVKYKLRLNELFPSCILIKYIPVKK